MAGGEVANGIFVECLAQRRPRGVGRDCRREVLVGIVKCGRSIVKSLISRTHDARTDVVRLAFNSLNPVR